METEIGIAKVNRTNICTKVFEEPPGAPSTTFGK